MSELVIIAEGRTEQRFARDVLAAHLANRGVVAWAVLSGRYRDKGGVRKWKDARADILRTLTEGRYCTTMFDYYGMPRDWPGRKTAPREPWCTRATHVERALATDIATKAGPSFDPAQFIPCVQLHEFEAILFSDPDVLSQKARGFATQPSSVLAVRFHAIVAEATSPEAIDDGYETCPSRRIAAEAPRYSKRVNGPLIAAAIGLATIRARCPHFNHWLTRLESLAPRD